LIREKHDRGRRMRQVINEVAHASIDNFDPKKTYCAVCGYCKALHKLHRVDSDHNYAWVEMFGSKYWANGEHVSPKQAIQSMLDSRYCRGVYEIDNIYDMISLLNKIDRGEI